jgi:DNA repair protein RadC
MKKPFKKIAKSDCYQVCNQVTEAQIMATAMEIVTRRFKRGNALSAPSETMAYLSVQHAGLEHELFSVMFMDNRNRVISYDPMFNGTIDGASVYPREVVKRALACNAAAVILTNNHLNKLNCLILLIIINLPSIYTLKCTLKMLSYYRLQRQLRIDYQT